MKEKVTRLTEHIGTILLVVMSTLVFLQVISRFILKIPLPWIEEFSKLTLIWLTYILLMATFSRNYHVRVDYIDEMVSKKTSLVINFIVQLLGIVVTSFTLYYTFNFFMLQLKFGQATPVLGLSMYIVLIPVLLGTLLGVLHFIMQSFSLLKRIKDKRWEEEV